MHSGILISDKAAARTWLTVRRIRVHATLLAVCVWSFYVWTLWTPGLRDRSGNLKGTDFLHFYTLGLIADSHRSADLYNVTAQAELAEQRVPAAAGIRYLPLYPPQVSLLFAPLARFSYGTALGAWWIFSAILYGLCCYFIWRTCPNLSRYKGTVALAAVAFPAFFHLIAWGQTAALALVCFTALFFLLRARREFWAGLVLGCLIFKPQLGITAAIVFLSIGAWRILLGAIVSAIAQLLAGTAYYGWTAFRQWIETLLNLRTVLPWLEPRLYQTHSLRTFWTMLVPWNTAALTLYILSAVVVLGIAVAVWRRGKSVSLGLRYSTLLLATVLVAPHLTVYDLVILAPAILLIADWLIAYSTQPAARMLGTLTYLVYILPLFGPLAQWTHVQLSVIAMTACVFMIWRAAFRWPAEPSKITLA